MCTLIANVTRGQLSDKIYLRRLAYCIDAGDVCEVVDHEFMLTGGPVHQTLDGRDED